MFFALRKHNVQQELVSMHLGMPAGVLRVEHPPP